MDSTSPKTFLVCHGAWSAGWAWKKMHPLMSKAGHRLVTPSYTGLGERAHLAHPAIDLETHITDMLNVIKYEDLRDFVLIGHSYGGMVATGVADRARDKVRQLKSGDGWRVPPNPTSPDTPPEDVAWLNERRVNMPLQCLEQPLKLSAPLSLPRSYIYASRISPADVFGRFAKMAKNNSAWRYRKIDASHSP